MNISLVILLIFATFTSSTLIERQESLKSCEGTFPNEITSYSFNPYPIVVGQLVTVHMTGKIAVPIEKEASLKHSIYYNNELRLEHEEDFCKFVVIPSGFTCPVTNDFDFTITIPARTTPNDPKNTVLEFFTRTLSKFLNI
jgi:hypothetical protein